jgi:phosphoglycerol transferase MdoB-like AlkP superfamily enzyme
MRKRIGSLIASLKPPRTVLFFGAMFLLGLVFLEFLRLGFLYRHRSIAVGIPTSTILHSFLIGARFDMVVLSYIFIPLFILSYLPFIGIHRLKVSRAIIQTILFLCFALVFILSLIDIEHFGEFGTRLSFWAFEYLDQPAMVWYSIRSGYPVISYLLLWAILTFLFVWAGIRISKKIFRRKQKEKIASRILYLLLALALLFLGARGRWQIAPIDWGLAYFSPYGFANQLALNGVYTLGKSFMDEQQDIHGELASQFHFFPTSQALSNVQKILVTPQERLTDSLNSLSRWYYPGSEASEGSALVEKENKNYNVVIILLESWLARFVGALGGKPGVTPNFDSLAEKGILFENFFATGTRTNRGIPSVVCSYPSSPVRSIMKKLSANRPFTSLAEILKQREYQSIVVYGGDLQFDNMEGFLRSEGFEAFVGQTDFPSKVSLGKWGVPDHIVFERANQEFSKFDDSPFLGLIITLSNHEPFLLPHPSFEIFPKGLPYSDYLNTFHYSDWALGEFFHEAEKEPYFKNTIFVLVGDHGKLLENQSDMPLERYRIACLIYAPALLDFSPKKVTTISSQTDLLPTILGLLGKPVLHQSWGRDLLSLPAQDGGFALMIDGKRVGWVEDTYFFIDRIGATPSLFDFNQDPQQKNDLAAQFPNLVKKFQIKERSFLQLAIEMTAKKKE